MIDNFEIDIRVDGVEDDLARTLVRKALTNKWLILSLSLFSLSLFSPGQEQLETPGRLVPLSGIKIIGLVAY